MILKRASAFVLVALAVSSCTAILGLDYDYVPRNGTGGAGLGGQSTSSSSSSSSGTGGTLPACGSFVWDELPGCQACMANTCCQELLRCDAGTPCAIFRACADQCAPNQWSCKLACLQADDTDHAGKGLTDYNALFDCNAEKCRDPGECAFPVCDSGFSVGERDCADCLASKASCCDSVKACENDAGCLACLADPGKAGCSANPVHAAVVNCQNETCGEVCAYSICGSPLFGYWHATCNYCVTSGTVDCCNQFEACVADTSSLCYKCLSGTTSAGCANDTAFKNWNTCVDNNCGVYCSGI